MGKIKERHREMMKPKINWRIFNNRDLIGTKMAIKARIERLEDGICSEIFANEIRRLSKEKDDMMKLYWQIDREEVYRRI